jgi:hypothetical protein
MNATDLTVQEARAQLASAEERQAQDRRDATIEELKMVRAQLAKARGAYQVLAGRVKEEREFKARMKGHIEQLDEAIRQNWSQRPAVAEHLPDDPDVVAWNKERQRFARQREKLNRELQAAPETRVVDLVYYNDPAVGIIPNLERAEANLLTALDPHAKDWMKGGIYGVTP